METSLTTGIMDVNIGLMQANALFFVGNVILLKESSLGVCVVISLKDCL